MALTKSFEHRGHDSYNDEVSAWVSELEESNPGKYVSVVGNDREIIDGVLIVTVTYEMANETWYDRVPVESRAHEAHSESSR